MPATGWCPSDEWSISPSRRQNATCASDPGPGCGNTSTPLSSSASSTASPSASSVASRSRVDADDLGADGCGELVDGQQTHGVLSSRHRFADAVDDRVGGVGGLRLAEDLDGHRDHDHANRSGAAGSARPRADRRAGTCRSSRSPLRAAGRTRRRTRASPASGWPSACSSVRLRLPDTSFSANGSSSANALGSRVSVIVTPPPGCARAGTRRPSRRRPCAGGAPGSPGR